MVENMADFDAAFDKVIVGHEGGYVNDKNDFGGETYCGISRRYHPSWSGWVIIDKYKKDPHFPDILYIDIYLNNEVRQFYKEYYWDVNLLDEITSQDIADELFDIGVNMGIRRATKFLQEAINYLNKCGTICNDLSVDGIMGPNTLKALSKIILYRGVVYVFKVLNILQGCHYCDEMKKNPSQEKYAYGWFDRVTFIKQ